MTDTAVLSGAPEALASWGGRPRMAKGKKKPKGMYRHRGGYGEEAGERDSGNPSPGSMTAGGEKQPPKRHAKKERR